MLGNRLFRIRPRSPIARRREEVQRISQVLQLPVVEEWSGAFPVGPEALQIRNFARVDAGAELGVREK